MRFVNAFVPEGLHRLIDYRRRFRQLGVSPNLSFSRTYRQAIEITNIEMLPRDIPLRYVVDVGANVGNWSVGMMLLRQPEVIIAFEPLPDIYEQLVNNTKPFPNIRTVNAAVGGTNGQMRIHQEARSEFSSILPMHNAARIRHNLPASERVEQIEVRLVTLDEVLAHVSEISLLKMDVQGYEAEVLKGAQQTLLRTKILMTEVTYYEDYYLGSYRCMELANAISAMSSLQLWSISGPHYSSDGIPLWADAVFVAP